MSRYATDRWPTFVRFALRTSPTCWRCCVDCQMTIGDCASSRCGMTCHVRRTTRRMSTTCIRSDCLATVGSPERIVGHALYAPAGDGRAEVAFAIAAEYQGQGLATILLGQLADAAATAEQYAHSIGIIADDPNVDTLISIFLPPLATPPEDVARSLLEAVDRLAAPKPVLAVFMSAQPLPVLTSPGRGRVPGYHTPEPAAIALGHAVRYAAWRSRPVEDLPMFSDLEVDEAGALLENALERGGGWLQPNEVRQLLGMYGVSVVDQRLVATVAEAANAAAELGPPGVEMLVGVVNDPHFGPTIACGAGGTLVELLKDVSVRLSPLTRTDAASMLRELRSFPLLEGYRGGPKCDVAALENVLLRISALVEDHPHIAEMDCNPVMVSASGAVVVDARVRVAPAPPRCPLGARRS